MEGRTIVFLDESGLSQRPHRVRTWARKGKTPVLQCNFNWKLFSAITGMTFWNSYLQLFPKTIRSTDVNKFLRHLKASAGTAAGDLGRLPADRSRVVQEWARDGTAGFTRTTRQPMGQS